MPLCARPALARAAGADWEGVVLIPFIDEQRLLAAARSIPPSSLTEEERQRNMLGDILVFSHAPGEARRSCCFVFKVCLSVFSLAAQTALPLPGACGGAFAHGPKK